jgi:hypothetical protein
MIQNQAIPGYNLTTMKNRGCVAVVFHRGPSSSHNSMEFKDLWRQCMMKNALDVFHRALAGFTLPPQMAP